MDNERILIIPSHTKMFVNKVKEKIIFNLSQYCYITHEDTYGDEQNQIRGYRKPTDYDIIYEGHIREAEYIYQQICAKCNAGHFDEDRMR